MQEIYCMFLLFPKSINTGWACKGNAKKNLVFEKLHEKTGKTVVFLEKKNELQRVNLEDFFLSFELKVKRLCTLYTIDTVNDDDVDEYTSLFKTRNQLLKIDYEEKKK